MPDDAQLELTSRAPSQAIAVRSEAADLMAVITRAASDPHVDVTKLERLMEMYERITAGRAKAAYDAALAMMQPELPIVERHGKIIIRDKSEQKNVIQSTPYALFEDINEAVCPVLAKHGFAITFRTSAENKIKVTAILSHREGHREETSLELQHDSTGSKNAVQAIGSSVSYGKRYTMCAILNITTRGEDDDGKAGGNIPISEDQLRELDELIKATKTDVAKFLKFMGTGALYEIPSSQFDKAKHALESKRAKS